MKKKCLYCDYVGEEDVCPKCKFFMEEQCKECSQCITKCFCKKEEKELSF